MKDLILNNCNNPEILEDAFDREEATFRKAIDELHSEQNHPAIIDFWYVRLNRKPIKNETGSSFMNLAILMAILAGIMSKLPEFLELSSDSMWKYYQYNIPFIFIPFIAYFLKLKNAISTDNFKKCIIGLLVAAAFINFYCGYDKNVSLEKDVFNSLILLHIPVFSWFLLVFLIPFQKDKQNSVVEFYRFSANFFVFCVILFIIGGLFCGLFYALIGIFANKIDFLWEWIMPFGAAASTVISAYIVTNYPTASKKILPLVSRWFSPLITLTLGLFFYLMLFKIESFYESKESLSLLNYSLLFSLGILLFSMIDIEFENKNGLLSRTLLILSIAILLLVSFILSACFYWLFVYGYSPFRFSATLLNGICATYLFFISLKLWKFNFSNNAKTDFNRIHYYFFYAFFVYLIFAAFILPLTYYLK